MEKQEIVEKINSLKGRVIGISDGELFIVGCINILYGNPIYNVVRPVSADNLAYLRGEDGDVYEEYREYWLEAVKGGYTDLGLHEWVDDLISESNYDDEAFPMEDKSFCECFDENNGLREWADDCIADIDGTNVGTWEASGCFPPKKPFTHIWDREAYDTLKELGFIE